MTHEFFETYSKALAQLEQLFNRRDFSQLLELSQHLRDVSDGFKPAQRAQALRTCANFEFKTLLIQADTATRARRFDEAALLFNEAEKRVIDLPDEARSRAPLALVRGREYMAEISQQSAGDWMAEYYAGSAGAQAVRDIKHGRSKVIDLTSKA